MPDINADPDKLRQFARTLTGSEQKLNEIVSQLQRGLEATGWKDRERQRFEQDFRQTLQGIRKAGERLKGHVPELNKKADALDRFRA